MPTRFYHFRMQYIQKHHDVSPVARQTLRTSIVWSEYVISLIVEEKLYSLESLICYTPGIHHSSYARVQLQPQQSWQQESQSRRPSARCRKATYLEHALQQRSPLLHKRHRESSKLAHLEKAPDMALHNTSRSLRLLRIVRLQPSDHEVRRNMGYQLRSRCPWSIHLRPGSCNRTSLQQSSIRVFRSTANLYRILWHCATLLSRKRVST